MSSNLPVKLNEVHESEIVNSENISTALVSNEQDLQNAKKITEKELKLRQEIFANIQSITQHDQAIYYQNIFNEQQRLNFISNVQNLHNQTLNYLELVKGIKIWKSSTGKDIYFRINPYGKKNKIISDDDIISFFNFHIKIYNNIQDVLIYDNTFIIVKSLLTTVHQDIFTLNVSSEFFTHQNINYRNTFEYSKYLNKRNLVNDKLFLQNQLLNLQNHPHARNPYYQDYSYFHPQQSYYQAPSIPEQIEQTKFQLTSLEMQLQIQSSFILSSAELK